ncbi:MAG: T9SS type A sorting domain-containing protein, partial [Bacteroidota bacterium]
ASAWDWLHVALYENTGSPNSYVRAANTANVDTTIDFSNMGFVEANFDNNATNELYIATAKGKVYVMTNPGDVSLITAANFSFLQQYNPYRGIAGLSKGDIDGNSIPELYLAGSYHEGVFQWKYAGGSVTISSSYQKSTIFQDDTTDSRTPGSDQGWFRPSKVAVGDFDSDGTADIVIASASFARDKPILMVVEQSPTGVAGGTEQPTWFTLTQNYPNPFNPTTNIGFRISNFGFVSLKVYDVLGREISVLVNDKLNPGTYKVTWEGDGLASGVYYCRLTTNGLSGVKKMTLVR